MSETLKPAHEDLACEAAETIILRLELAHESSRLQNLNQRVERTLGLDSHLKTEREIARIRVNYLFEEFITTVGLGQPEGLAA